MINKVFFGEPLNFKDRFKIYPPLTKEVAIDEKILLYMKILTSCEFDVELELYGDEGSDGKPVPSPFEFLLSNCYNSKDFESLTKMAFKYFIREPITILYDQKSILIGTQEEVLNCKKIEDLRFITESDYLSFQNLIREVCGKQQIQELPKEMHPKIRRMKFLSFYRDTVKSRKGKGVSLGTSLVAICCMGIGITPLNIGEIPYAVVNRILESYQTKEKYDLDIRSLLAGADSKKVKPEYWIKED